MKASAFVLLIAIAGLSGGLASTQRTSRHIRSLQQFRPPLVFPYGRCGNFSSKGVPYYLFGPDTETDDQGITSYTFGIGYKGPQVSPIPCYTALETSLYKVMIHIYTECVPALRVAGLTARVNGMQRAVHTYMYPDGTTLAISNLNFNSTTADGTVFTIRASAPCDRPGLLFKPNKKKNVSMEYSFSESRKHKCCGRSV